MLVRTFSVGQVCALIVCLCISCTLCRSAQGEQKDPDARGQPVSRVHVDYTVKSGPERLQAVLPDEAEELMKTPFAVIQVRMVYCAQLVNSDLLDVLCISCQHALAQST